MRGDGQEVLRELHDVDSLGGGSCVQGDGLRGLAGGVRADEERGDDGEEEGPHSPRSRRAL